MMKNFGFFTAACFLKVFKKATPFRIFDLIAAGFGFNLIADKKLFFPINL